MQRDAHVALWLRLLATKELFTARQIFRLLRAQGAYLALEYQTNGEFAALSKATQSVNEFGRLLVLAYATTTRDIVNYTNEQLTNPKKAFLDLVQSFIAREALKKATFIAKTNASLIREVIAKGFEQGLSEALIAKDIKETLGGSLAIERAKTIARTEIHNAATYGMQAAAEETQLNLTREWVSVHDERTREAHVEADGQRRGLFDPFDVGGESINRPGEGSPENSINCRCTIIYLPQGSE